jgi:hypothetical protein
MGSRMARATPQSFVTGFDCRACGGPIPVFAGSPEEVAPTQSAIHIMCPDCGHAGEYLAGEAYRFGPSWQQGAFGPSNRDAFIGPKIDLVAHRLVRTVEE